jgi:hypothetical protein
MTLDAQGRELTRTAVAGRGARAGAAGDPDTAVARGRGGAHRHAATPGARAGADPAASKPCSRPTRRRGT